MTLSGGQNYHIVVSLKVVSYLFPPGAVCVSNGGVVCRWSPFLFLVPLFSLFSQKNYKLTLFVFCILMSLSYCFFLALWYKLYWFLISSFNPSLWCIICSDLALILFFFLLKLFFFSI